MADCIEEIFVYDEGTSIEFEIYTCESGVETGVDISSATEQEIVFVKPDGTLLEVAGEHLTDGTDFITRYKTLATDLDQAGDWQGQARVRLEVDGKWHTSIIEFEVLERLFAT